MDFKKRVDRVIQNGCISFALQAAKEVGIFDSLKDADKPLTAQQLADRLQLKERYVREILGCLTGASLIEISTGSEGQLTYFLTGEAKDVVQTSLAFVDVGLIGLLTSVYPSVKACFPLSGPHGIQYGEKTFNFLDEKATIYTPETITHILDKVSGLQELLEHGINVIEFGSGTGRLLSNLATRFPRSIFTATDVIGEAVSKMKQDWGSIPNMHFKTVDLGHIDASTLVPFDWALVINTLHHLPHPLIALNNVRRILKADSGLITVLDMASPGNHAMTAGNEAMAALYATSTFLCVPDSFQTEDSEAHGPCWTKQTVESLMSGAGFQVTVKNINDKEFIFVGKA